VKNSKFQIPNSKFQIPNSKFQNLNFKFCLVALVLLLYSCSNEENTGINPTDAITNQLKKDLKLDQFKNQTFAKNLVLNWESIKRTEKDGIEIYEIEVKEKNPTIIKSNLFQNKLKYELIIIKKENVSYSYLIEAYSSLKYALFNNSVQKLKNFTGTLNVFKLDGSSINQLVVNNGKSKNPSGNSSLNTLNEVINLYNTSPNINSRVPECTLSEYVYSVYSIYTNHYTVTVGTSSYTTYYTTLKTVTITELMSVPCGTSEDSYDITKRFNVYRDVFDVEIIDELTGKAKCLNALLDKNGNSFVQNLLANFEGKSEFNINIVSKDIVTNKDENGIVKEINGKTTYVPGSTSITIEINTSRIDNTSALDAARTILHEYIHADILRKLNTQYPSTGDLDFKKTYEAYGNQHGAMGALYINSMRDALKEFHKNVLTDDYNKYTNYYGEAPTDAFYEALAWGGLRENDVKAWVDLSAEKKQQ